MDTNIPEDKGDPTTAPDDTLPTPAEMLPVYGECKIGSGCPTEGLRDCFERSLMGPLTRLLARHHVRRDGPDFVVVSFEDVEAWRELSGTPRPMPVFEEETDDTRRIAELQAELAERRQEVADLKNRVDELTLMIDDQRE